MSTRMKKGLNTFLALALLLGAMFIGAPSSVDAATITFAGGDGSESNPYLIEDPAQVDEIRHYLSSHFKLIQSIDMEVYNNEKYDRGNWESIGSEEAPFTGTLDGNGYSITGLEMENHADDPESISRLRGLFRHIGEAGVIENLGVGFTSYFTNGWWIGGLAGKNEGTIRNSFAFGSMTQYGANTAGGLVAVNKGTIEDSYTMVEVNMEKWEKSAGLYIYAEQIGGLAGYNTGTIRNSHAKKPVSGDSSVGGLVGRNIGTITSSAAFGAVSATLAYAGGLAGESSGNITNSYARGAVSGHDYVGGLAGRFEEATLSGSFATGAVTGQDAHIGGLLGDMYDGNILNSYARGDVTMAGSGTGNWVSGLVGGANNGGTIVNSYATGAVSGGEVYERKGLVAYPGTVTGSFYDNTFNYDLWEDTANVPKSYSDLHKQSTYEEAGWDFETVWGMAEGHNGGYPYLRALTGPDVKYTITVDWAGKGSGVNQMEWFSDKAIDYDELPRPTTVRDHFALSPLFNYEPSYNYYTRAALDPEYLFSDTTLYVEWSDDDNLGDYIVTFDSLEGSAVPGISNASRYGKILEPAAPTRSGYTFAGWYKNEYFTKQWGFEEGVLSDDLTLYAKWVPVGGDSGTGGDDSSGDDGGSSGDGGDDGGSSGDGGGSGTDSGGDGGSSDGGSGGMGGGTPGLPAAPDDGIATADNGELSLPVGKAGEVSLDGDKVTIEIPADASDEDLKLTIERWSDTQSLVSDKEVLLSDVYEIVKSFKENFKKPVKLKFAFDPAKLGSGEQPSVFYYDETGKKWIEVGGVADGSFITAEVDHFTKFAVFAVASSEDEEPIAVEFNDIAGHWAEAAIRQAVSEGIASGYSGGTFQPDRTVTRAEFAVMLARALKWTGEGSALTFTDAARIPTWAGSAVRIAVQAGVIHGYDDGTFRSDAQVTRAEMAVMIAAALKLEAGAPGATAFADDNAIPSWARGAAAKLKELGLMVGDGENRFHPAAHATRAEAVTVLLQLLKKTIG